MIRIRIKLSTLLGERRIKQSELAARTGITRATINHYYHEDIDRISLEHICLICEALHCHVLDLLVEEDVDGEASALEDYMFERENRLQARRTR